jgi:hypothetical protein
MKKEFVPCQESVELKELGFDEPCMCFYNNRKELKVYHNVDKDWNTLEHQLLSNLKITLSNTYTAPTFSQAFRWFREKYFLNSKIFRDGGYWIAVVNSFKDEDYFSPENKSNTYGLGVFDTYEEAELACLRKLIEIVKERK